MIEQTIESFRRRLTCEPGYCWIKDNSKRNFGIAAMKFRFVLIGELGAVQWLIGSNWMPEAARMRVSTFPMLDRGYYEKPQGWDLGYHSPKPMYDGQTPAMDKCDVLEHGQCYYDGSGLNADELIEGFLNGGDEWVWRKLEEYYDCTFKGGEWPDFTPDIVPHPDDRIEAA